MQNCAARIRLSTKQTDPLICQWGIPQCAHPLGPVDAAQLAEVAVGVSWYGAALVWAPSVIMRSIKASVKVPSSNSGLQS